MKKFPVGWSSFLYLWFFLLIGLPLVVLVGSSFSDGIGQFWQSLTSAQCVFALKLSAIISVIAVAINASVGLIASVGIARGTMPGRRIVSVLMDIPFSVPPVIGGLAILLIYGPDTTLGGFLSGHGIKIAFAVPGMVLATMFVTMPLVVRELVPVLRATGTVEEEAAMTLGANRWVAFWRITFPQIKWALVYGTVLTLARALGEFGAVLVLSGNVLMLTQTATQFIYQSVSTNDIQAASAVAIVLATVSVIILLVMELLRKRRGATAH